jgi:hypothetical protein
MQRNAYIISIQAEDFSQIWYTLGYTKHLVKK